MKTTVKTYRNKYNDKKFIEVHDDNYRHLSVKQYIKCICLANALVITNTTGDGKLHRMSVKHLRELLKDYEEV